MATLSSLAISIMAAAFLATYSPPHASYSGSRRSKAFAIDGLLKYLLVDQSSSCSASTVPTRRTSDAVEGKTCTTRERLLISLLMRSCTLLVQSRLLRSLGKPGYARASASASSKSSPAL